MSLVMSTSGMMMMMVFCRLSMIEREREQTCVDDVGSPFDDGPDFFIPLFQKGFRV